MFENLFQKLDASPFRSKFKLTEQEKTYIQQKGMDIVCRHAQDFVEQRLAPALPKNDGKQTPMRGHPIFKAQHATGCCCRGCLYKWHHIPQGRPLSPQEQDYIVEVLMAWISRHL